MPAKILDSQVVEEVGKGSPELLSTGNNLRSGQLESVATGIAEFCKIEQKIEKKKTVSKTVFWAFTNKGTIANTLTTRRER